MDHIAKLIMSTFENEMHDIELKDAINNAVYRFNEQDCQNVAIPYILKMIEKYPQLDWGTPGGFAHYMEEYIDDGYIDYLLESFNRKPTTNTAFLLFRCANNAEDKTIFLDAFEKSRIIIGTNHLREDVEEYIEWLK